MQTADREGLARAIDPHAFVWPATPERQAQALAKADEFLAPLTADVARLSAEMEARDRVLRALMAWIDTDLEVGTPGAGSAHMLIGATLEGRPVPALARTAGQDKTEGDHGQ